MESRNTRFGYELHKNNYSNEFINAYPFLVEGLEAAKLIKPLLSKYNINFDYLPIISSVIEIAKNTISTQH
jgi:glycerol-3-phosphate dehydrogenase